MSSTRVQVTGIGFVTPLGCTTGSFDDALFHGHSAVRA